ncbi:MAG: molybdopterin-dependent oxidoreductase [Acidobacteriota bacterium]
MMKRRNFIKLTGSTLAGLALSNCGKKDILINFVEREDMSSKWIPSICDQCFGGCGVLVKVKKGRVINLKGNPYHPVNRGGLCPKGLASLQLIYNPDRIKTPIKKVGNRFSKEWKPISWEEAIEIISTKLKELRERKEPEKFVILGNRNRSVGEMLISRFAEAYGTPNYVKVYPLYFNPVMKANYLTHGIDDIFAYDFEETNFILSFSSHILEDWISPVRAMNAFGFIRQGREKRAKIIHVEPRLSYTGNKADEWIRINPGTEGLFALGIANVLIKEELYDKEFIENFTFGFFDWTDESGVVHKGFKDFVTKEYYLDDISVKTGVSVADIVRIAKEFAETKPAIAIVDLGVGNYTNSLYSNFIIHSLNALVGSIDKKGGVVVPSEIPLESFPSVTHDRTSEEGIKKPRIDKAGTDLFPLATDVVNQVAISGIKGDPYDVEILLLDNFNPIFFENLDSNFKNLFEKISFIISHSTFLDESSVYADLVLPKSTFFESWQDCIAFPLGRYTVFSVGQPAVESFGNMMNFYDLIIHVAKKIGGSVGESFLWRNYREVLDFSIDGIFKSNSGTIISYQDEEKEMAELEERGFWTSKYENLERFRESLFNEGAWCDFAYYFSEWSRVFRTPSKKYEFYSLILKNKLEEICKKRAVKNKTSIKYELEKLSDELKISQRGDFIYLPHFEPPRYGENEVDYPFQLNLIRIYSNRMTGDGNLPFLQEISGNYINEKWESWAEIHPEIAKEMHISDGDYIWVESSKGRIKVKARFFEGTLKEVISIPVEFGHKNYGRWADGIGSNVFKIINYDYDYVSGSMVFLTTRVKVYKS